MRTVQHHDGHTEDAGKTCFYCGSKLDRKGNPLSDQEHEGRYRDQAIFKRLAWELRDDPIKTIIMLYRVTDANMTLQNIADAITSIIATVHNRRPYMTRQAVLHHIKRICGELDDDAVSAILMPRSKNDANP